MLGPTQFGRRLPNLMDQLEGKYAALTYSHLDVGPKPLRSAPSWMRVVNLLDFAFDTSKPVRRVLTSRIQSGQSTVVPP